MIGVVQAEERNKNNDCVFQALANFKEKTEIKRKLLGDLDAKEAKFTEYILTLERKRFQSQEYKEEPRIDEAAPVPKEHSGRAKKEDTTKKKTQKKTTSGNKKSKEIRDSGGNSSPDDNSDKRGEKAKGTGDSNPSNNDGQNGESGEGDCLDSGNSSRSIPYL